MPAFLGNSSLNSMNSMNIPELSELLNWMSHYWITLLKIKTAIFSYINSLKTRISHAVTCSDMHAGSEKAPQVLAEGGSIEPVEPPWLRAWSLNHILSIINDVKLIRCCPLSRAGRLDCGHVCAFEFTGNRCQTMLAILYTYCLMNSLETSSSIYFCKHIIIILCIVGANHLYMTCTVAWETSNKICCTLTLWFPNYF